MMMCKKCPIKKFLLVTCRGFATLFSILIVLSTIKEEYIRQGFKEETNPENLPHLLTKTVAFSCGSMRKCIEVYSVLRRVGYQRNQTPGNHWDLLWTWEYPFMKFSTDLSRLKLHQKVNHIPGNGNLVSKVELATTKAPYISTAFRLPGQKEQLLEYSRTHPNTTFIQKGNMHRNIKIVNISNINLDLGGTFVQEFMDRPLLVDGHKFDIGIYTLVTSIDPLRVYSYNGEAGIRFCPEEYYPFDPANLDKYVIGDAYLPLWQMPVMDHYYNQMGFGLNESLHAYFRSQGKDIRVIWTQIEDSIRTTFLIKEQLISKVLSRYKYKNNFFELMRFDFIVDEDLRVYLLEVNMSPTLFSSSFPQNNLMYQRLLYNAFGLVGIRERLYKNTLQVSSEEEEMIVSDKQLATYPEKCGSELCKYSCESLDCQLCKFCLSPETRQDLVAAYKEHLHRGEYKRVFPPTESKEEASKPISGNYTEKNYLHYMWFKGKCLLDSSWC